MQLRLFVLLGLATSTVMAIDCFITAVPMPATGPPTTGPTEIDLS
ncbi:hypothetical protein Vi05172_g9362 [Venturia inaequalis]|nr:hypothetical protein Vi05172_g9362 [Venturia inaequalis]